MSDFDYFLEQLQMQFSDPAFHPGLVARHPSLRLACAHFLESTKPRPTGLPSILEMTAIQVAICDNWGGPSPVKNRPSRYGAVVEVWTKDASKIRTHVKGDYDHKVSGILMQSKELGSQVRRLRKLTPSPVSQDWLNVLEDYTASMTDADYVGLLAHKDAREGTIYFDGQAIFLEIVDGKFRANLFVDGHNLQLPKFSPFMPDDETKLGGNFVGQSRADLAGFSTSWATGRD
jgi:hypothetical protein